MNISAVIIAGNEESKIADAISSVNWVDEVLVVDSESTDNTRAIAEGMGANVITRPWPGFSAQKQFGIEAASFDWILSLDADERISPELRDEILNLRNVPMSLRADGYKMPRLSFYMDRAIRHSGWYPDWQLRFFNRQKGKWKDVLVHESFQMTADAKVEKLKHNILHYSSEGAQHHHEMIGKRYAPLAAQQLFNEGVMTSPISIALAGPVAFFSTFFLKLGFLDGLPGYCIARFAAQHAFMKKLCLWEIQNAKR
ncbi:MAG: glycosyltransferase family 2 protein [Chloracidobacterium sp.]|nr:glycosyltransferase family 2 protein [Chloracidobacterium sp.]